MRSLCCLMLAAGLLLAVSAHGKPLRGLDPALADKYDAASGRFACQDGSKTIDFKYVNDNFCDCQDGSDEPGTSACTTGQFYCRNLGHVAKTISSIFVDDGVCDCCDGSDERGGACSNKCLEEAAAIKAALQTKLANYEAALAKRAEYLERAKVKRTEMADRRASIDQEIEEQKRLIVELKEEKAKLDEEEAARKAEEEASAAAAQQAEQAQAEAEAAAAAAAAAATGEALANEGRALSEEQPKAEGAEGAEDAQREETAEERGRRIAAQWTNDPDAALKADQPEPVHHDDYVPEPDAHAAGGAAAAAGGAGGLLGKLRQLLEPLALWLSDKLGKKPAKSLAAVQSEGQSVQQRIWQEEANLQHLEDTRTKLDKQLVMDFGPGDLFLPLVDECYESDAVKYVYQVCMFEKAVQREGYTDTDIGKWGRFHTEAGVAKMVYENGAYCWEGPNRSMAVTLECGLEEKLTGGSEPSKCVYAASLETPAMCSEEERASLTRRLEELEELERTIAQQLKDEL